MNTKELLYELCTQRGVSGDEKNIAQTACKYLENYCRNVRITGGNVIAEFGSDDNRALNILLDAHMDQVGMIVTDITEKGFLKIDQVGGIDARLLPCQRVTVHGKENICGTVCTIPPHLTSGSDKEVIPVDECLVDTGYGFDELKNIVSRGDFISFDTPFLSLENNRVASPSLDDRSGMAAIIYALDILKNEKLNVKVTVLFSKQEELGELGAATGCFEINPNIALAVDVSFAKTKDDSKQGCGEFDKGAMIGISPSLSREVSNDLIAIAKNNNIPYQIEVMEGLTSTNADRFAICRGGVKACTVSIPLRYMHTPCEIISIKDVENTAKLISEYIKEVSRLG